MSKAKEYQGTTVQPGSQLWDLLESGKPEDLKKAKRLHEYTTKAAACFYEHSAIVKLRAEYADII